MSTSSVNEICIVEPTSEHTHTIILLHGRGSNGAEFQSEFFESQASDGRFLTDIFPSVKWYFPSSSIRHPDADEEPSQWFDIVSVQHPHEEQATQIQGLKQTIAIILNRIREEAALIGGMDKIILGGISQGCAAAILTLACGGFQIGGFIGISSWLPFREEIARACGGSGGHRVQNIRKILSLDRCADIGMSQETNPNAAFLTPVLLEHAEDDEVVFLEHGRNLCGGLIKWGMNVEWKCYEDGGHWVNEPQGIDDMAEFLQRITNLAA
ncbi:Alpha/Beta hydrolase protein [Dendryphion nanum]|uniref:Alpha/Beta hydrolase protein n=1 Tax=Dendryphion nanum TaxID=256645 RepID=A0A9P9D8X9_9PLEO|nr:Alpha/Beta hydrolase protein [Dendryphion nanum]